MQSEGAKVFISFPDGPSVLAAGGPCSHCGRSGRESTSCVAVLFTPHPNLGYSGSSFVKWLFPGGMKKGKTEPSPPRLCCYRSGWGNVWIDVFSCLFYFQPVGKQISRGQDCKSFTKIKTGVVIVRRTMFFFLLKIFYNVILILKSQKQTKSYFFPHTKREAAVELTVFKHITRSPSPNLRKSEKGSTLHSS